MHTPKSFAAATLALLFLAACGSSGMGDILGGGSPTNGNSNYEIRGTVESVDPNNQSIWLRNVDGYRSMLSNSGSGNNRGSEVRVYFDNQTTVEYQGRAYRPEDLERGDEVRVRVDESGNRLIASSMTVTHNVAGNTSNGNGSWPSSGTYNNPVVRGTVRYVDTSRGTLEVDRGGSMSSVIVDIDTRTAVYFNGQTYRVGDLERGDEVEIRVRETGGPRVLAQDITVTRSVQGGGTYGGNTSSQRSTVRGTIRQIDTSRRAIELEQTSWMSGFNSGVGGSSNRIVVQYSDNTQVDVNGRLHPMAGLERGDIVSVEVSGNGSTYWAERVYLVHDVNNRR